MVSKILILSTCLVLASFTNGGTVPKSPRIDLAKIKPAFMAVEKPDLSKLTLEQWKKIIEEDLKPMTTERFPGYKKGTINLSDECGVAGTGARIAGGNESPRHKYPWMASLFMHKDGESFFCGGTLLNNEWILTAGHCTDGFEYIDVFLGAHNILDDSEEGRLEVTAAEFFPHPSYNPIGLYNDVGLIRLPRQIQFTDTIRPVCLPTYFEENEKFANLEAPATGWGKASDDDGSLSPVLREVVTKTITNLVCFLELLGITANNICISGFGGKSTCSGDSGGPLHIIMDDGRYKQIGVTSFSLVLSCELGLHVAFMRTTSYLQFIETNTGLEIG